MNYTKRRKEKYINISISVLLFVFVGSILPIMNYYEKIIESGDLDAKNTAETVLIAFFVIWTMIIVFLIIFRILLQFYYIFVVEKLELEPRECYECKRSIFFEECLGSNPDILLCELIEYWKNPVIEFYCCHCYKDKLLKENII